MGTAEAAERWHWISVETGLTAPGCPDSNACCDGVEIWVELKSTASRRIVFQPFQPPWIHRRVRHGGNVWIMVRQKHDGGVRIGPPIDSLWLFFGDVVLELFTHGLESTLMSGRWDGGPRNWNWSEIDALLRKGAPKR